MCQRLPHFHPPLFSLSLPLSLSLSISLTLCFFLPIPHSALYPRLLLCLSNCNNIYQAPYARSSRQAHISHSCRYRLLSSTRSTYRVPVRAFRARTLCLEAKFPTHPPVVARSSSRQRRTPKAPASLLRSRPNLEWFASSRYPCSPSPSCFATLAPRVPGPATGPRRTDEELQTRQDGLPLLICLRSGLSCCPLGCRQQTSICSSISCTWPQSPNPGWRMNQLVSTMSSHPCAIQHARH